MKDRLLKTLSLICVITITIFSSCSSGNAQDDVLKLNLTTNKEYIYQMAIDLGQEWQGDSANSKFVVDYVLQMVKKNGNILNIRITYRRVTMRMRIAETTINVDTDLPFIDSVKDYMDMEKMANLMFRAIKDKSFIISVDEKGKIKDVDGFDKIREAVLEPTRKLNGLVNRLSDESLANYITEEGVRKRFEQGLFFYLGRKVKAGDVWEEQFKISDKSLDKLKTTYKVKSVTDSLVNIDMTATLVPADSNLQVQGTRTGSFVIDRKTGLIANGVINEVVNSKMGNDPYVKREKVLIDGIYK